MFSRIVHSVSVGVGMGVVWVVRVGPAAHLPSVGQPVAVGVRQVGVRPRLEFVNIPDAVAVCVSGPGALQRPEVPQLPLVGQGVAVRGKPLRTRMRHYDVVNLCFTVASASDARERSA